MNLNDDVGTPQHWPRVVIGWLLGNGSRYPSANEADSGNSWPTKTWIAPISTCTLACNAGGVGEHQRVMHDAPVIRPELEAAHVRVMIEIQWQKKTSVLIGTVGRQSILRRHGEDVIRLSALPAVRKRRCLRPIGRITLRRAVCGPVFDQGNLSVGQPALVREVAISRLRFPWRHVAAFG